MVMLRLLPIRNKLAYRAAFDSFTGLLYTAMGSFQYFEMPVKIALTGEQT